MPLASLLHPGRSESDLPSRERKDSEVSACWIWGLGLMFGV